MNLVTFTMTWIVTFHGAVVSHGAPSFITLEACQEARARIPANLPNGDDIRTTECVRQVVKQ